MAVTLLRISGLDDDDDERRLERRLRERDGVLGAVVSYRDGCAEVDLEDDVLDVDGLIATVEAAGFEAELAG